jgi:hypothetical protein
MDLDGGDGHYFSGSRRNSSTPSPAHSHTDERQIYYDDHMMDFDYRAKEVLPHDGFEFGVNDEYDLESDGRSMTSDDEQRGFGTASSEDITRTFHPFINGTVFDFH